ncbi:MAG: hypothetical protein LKF62_03245 [Solobacterium sp.]|nr:hypothetical protein [Solobacterium sp.]
MLNQKEQIGFLTCELCAKSTMAIDFSIQPQADEVMNELVETLIEFLTVKFHPAKFLTCTDQRELIQALKHHLFYPKGKKLQRVVEPWRSALADYVFDGRGYIINQGEMKQINFGMFSTREKGCGWISAYNLLKMNNLEHTMKDTARGLDRHAFLGELLGQDIMSLYFWLKSQGLNVQVTPYGRNRVLNAMKQSSSGILLYTHTHGAHYTAYHKEPDGKYHFYNAVYGMRYQIMDGEAFMEKYTVPLSLMVITVR